MIAVLALHIAADSVALVSAGGALVSTHGRIAHKYHMWFGRLYASAMGAVTVSALALSVTESSLFLFLIAIFSGYLTLAGWRFAKNRRGRPRLVDWASILVMGTTAAAMLAAAESSGVTLAVFGGIGGALAGADFAVHRSGGCRGRLRIGMHLTMMMSATIATVTAFLVTNISTDPEFIAWLLPTAALTPVITAWNTRIGLPKRIRALERSGDPELLSP